MTTTTVLSEDRIARLSTASVRRVLEPEELFDWSSMESGQVIADELLTTAGLDLDLDADTRARLSREEVASMLQLGIRFEAILNSGFALQIAETHDVADPRVTYMLHEIAEETRHQRAFIRLIEELDPRATNPLAQWPLEPMANFTIRRFLRMPALLMVLVLAGEEIPDLLQKMASEHPGTDPLLAAVNRYHRQEEARHLSFARTTLSELHAEAGWAERARIRHVAPVVIGGLFATFVHPGVYTAVGLPGFATWRAVNRTPERIAVRHRATRNILRALLDAEVVRPGRIPRGWRRLCGVDRNGDAIPGDVPLPGEATA
ncbi:MAG: diiron oxygenase [Acidimicrobiia bacterium]